MLCVNFPVVVAIIHRGILDQYTGKERVAAVTIPGRKLAIAMLLNPHKVGQAVTPVFVAEKFKVVRFIRLDPVKLCAFFVSQFMPVQQRPSMMIADNSEFASHCPFPPL
jgi:hypothetical protein